MSRKLIIVFSVLFAPFLCPGQNWQGLGTGANWAVRCLYSDTSTGILYAGGNFDTIGGIKTNGIAQWDGTNWDSLGSGGIGALAITKYNGEIYAGGFGGLKRWDGTSWNSVGLNSNWLIYCLYVYNNELYAGGMFDSIGGVAANSLAKWNGSMWSDVGAFPNYNFPSIYNAVNAISYFNGELYVGGNFRWIGGVEMDIVRWNGTTWNTVGNGFSGGFSSVSSFAIYNNELYAGGTFQTAYGNPGDAIAKWDGSNWYDVGGGMTSQNARIDNLKVINNELYAVGGFSLAGGVPALAMAKWDGINWCGFGIVTNNGFSYITTYNNEIIVTCDNILDGDTVNYIAKWVGGSYVDTCGNTTGIEEATQSFSVQVFPNPATTNTTFQITGLDGNKTLIIYDPLGREIWRKESRENQIEFSAGSFAAGLYFYRVEQDDELKANGKLLIEYHF